jgi:hypothetical protein
MMKFLARMLGYSATAMALCTGLFLFAGKWFGEEGSARQLALGIALEMRREQALEDCLKTFNQTLEARDRVFVEVVGGRLRLREAIDQVQRLHKEINDDLADKDPGKIAGWVPLPTDPETLGRVILRWGRLALAAWPPDKAKRRVADLEKEFRELFGLLDGHTELSYQPVGQSREPHREPR